MVPITTGIVLAIIRRMSLVLNDVFITPASQRRTDPTTKVIW